MKKNLKRPDFSRLKKNKFLLLKSALIPLFFAFFFYKKILAGILLAPIGYLYYRQEEQMIIQKEKDELSVEFKEMITSISANLQAGYAIENAFSEARKDMLMLYGENAEIVRQMDQIIKGIRNRIPIEKLLMQFGERSQIREIQDFSEVFLIAKRTGGDLIKIIHSSSDIISKKIEVQNEIRTQISAKLFEQQIMNLVPFGIVGYISLTTPHFFDSMYGNVKGILIMTVCMVLYLVSYGMSQKIIRIKI